MAIMSRRKPVVDAAVARLQAQGAEAFGLQVRARVRAHVREL